MSRMQYQKFNFREATLETIAQANIIIEEYQEQGFNMTLRQLYYQFVARDLLDNTQQNYKKLGSTINDARLGGLIDWDAIIDHTRNLCKLDSWTSPSDILTDCIDWYREDMWADQDNYVEVWIEKDALIGVIERVCQNNDVPFFSCRGYTSQSEMHSAAMRMIGYCRRGQEVHIIHLGDHDPSGIDMSRDITDRLRMFMRRNNYTPAKIHRIALNMDQVEQYDPPPNPTKLTDSRAPDYINKFGNDSWELDALEPSVMEELILDKINELRDEDQLEESHEAQEENRERLRKVVGEAIDKLEEDDDEL